MKSFDDFRSEAGEVQNGRGDGLCEVFREVAGKVRFILDRTRVDDERVLGNGVPASTEAVDFEEVARDDKVEVDVPARSCGIPLNFAKSDSAGNVLFEPFKAAEFLKTGVEAVELSGEGFRRGSESEGDEAEDLTGTGSAEVGPDSGGTGALASRAVSIPASGSADDKADRLGGREVQPGVASAVVVTLNTLQGDGGGQEGASVTFPKAEVGGGPPKARVIGDSLGEAENPGGFGWLWV